MGRGPTRRELSRDLGLGTLALLLGGCGRTSAAGRRGREAITGGYVDDGARIGHALRDAALGSGAPARTETRRVVVVGGGVAGLSAAWRLARSGVEDVVVLELRGALGGTARGGDFALPGADVIPHPFGAHYLPVPRADQTAVAAFLFDAGLADGVDANGRLRVADELLVRDPAERVAGLGGFFEEGLWLRAGASERDVREFERFEALVEAAIRVDPTDGRRPFDLPLARSGAAERGLDATSAAEWFTAQGFTSARVRWHLEYAARDDFGARLEDTSAYALLHYFTARADLASKESAPYMTWPDGNARLVRALAELAGVEVRTGEAALLAATEGQEAVVRTVAPERGGQVTEWRADAVVLATPQFVTRRILAGDPAADARAAFRYGPWLVANLHLERRPANRGFPWAWDSVLHESKSLGYVDAGHQLDRADREGTVWTWYLPVTDSDERGARRRMLEAPWETVRDAILADLRRAHPGIDEVVRHIDVWRWGHGMVKPVPGFLWANEARQRAARAVGRVFPAHSDLSGLALFEEAHWQGTRAAEEALAFLGVTTESLL